MLLEAELPEEYPSVAPIIDLTPISYVSAEECKDILSQLQTTVCTFICLFEHQIGAFWVLIQQSANLDRGKFGNASYFHAYFIYSREIGCRRGKQ